MIVFIGEYSTLIKLIDFVVLTTALFRSAYIIYMYIYIYIHTHTHIYIYIYSIRIIEHYIYVCVYICVCVYIYICICVYIYIYMNEYEPALETAAFTASRSDYGPKSVFWP